MGWLWFPILFFMVLKTGPSNQTKYTDRIGGYFNTLCCG